MKTVFIIFFTESLPQRPSLQTGTLYETYESQVNEDKKLTLKEDILSDQHIRLIAEKLENWKENFDLFGLDRNPHLYDIEQKNKDNPLLQR